MLNVEVVREEEIGAIKRRAVDERVREKLRSVGFGEDVSLPMRGRKGGRFTTFPPLLPTFFLSFVFAQLGFFIFCLSLEYLKKKEKEKKIKPLYQSIAFKKILFSYELM